MIEQGLPNDFSLLPEYSKILELLIELDEQLQKKAPQYEEKCVNDVFSVIEKAYWGLYLEENYENLSEQQQKEIRFYLTSKIGKSLDSELSKTGSSNSQVPKWFLYKGYGKKEQRDRRYNEYRDNSYENDGSMKNEWGLKHENSLKTEEKEDISVDPYHANIKLEAENGLPEIEVIYKFFSIKSMLRNSTDMLDIEKITIIHRRGNSFDREDEREVERQKEKFRQKFRLYSELIRCFEYYGYGARIAKKHSKEKVTGIMYQYAVVHISKIAFKLLEKYVMNFINKKTRYTHRAKLEKITYNMFNLPNFFTPELKLLFIKLIKIVFEVEEELPVVTKEELHELYNYLIKQISEKEKNPDKFKNEYMIKLENPTFYNVKKELRDQVKQEAEERKRLGIRNKGRRSKASIELNELKRSLAEEQEFFEGRSQDIKREASQSYEKKEHSHKKKDKKIKKEEYFSEDEFDEDLSEYKMDHEIDYSDDEEQNYYDSDEESEEIRDYFRKSNLSKRSSKKKAKKSKKNKKKNKSKDYQKSAIYSDDSD